MWSAYEVYGEYLEMRWTKLAEVSSWRALKAMLGNGAFVLLAVERHQGPFQNVIVTHILEEALGWGTGEKETRKSR